MALNRKSVEKYVAEHWFTPCDDGVIYSYIKGTVHVEAERAKLKAQGKLPGDGWKAVLLPYLDDSGQVVIDKERGCFIRSNPAGQEIVANYKPPELSGKFDIVPFYLVKGEHDGLVDCAHYVSRCLTAGKIAINQPGVPGLVQQLRARNDTRTLGLEIPRLSGQRIMNSGVMKFGDVIAFFHEDPKTHETGYAHSAIYTGFDKARGLHRLSCHTTARFNEFFFDTTWNITEDPSWRYTLIHFTDDTFPPITQPMRFQVTQNGNSETWEFRPQGHIVRAKGNSPSLGAMPQDRGYWFAKGVNIFVFWTRTGQVAKIGLVSFDNSDNFPITIDNQPATMQTV